MPEKTSDATAKWLRNAIDQYEGQLIRYAARFTGSSGSARDVVQDTFMSLCKQERAKVNGHLAAWLFTVCRNRALEIRRKQIRVRELSEKDMATRPAEDPGPSVSAEQKEIMRRVFEAMASLPEPQQEAVRLKFQSGLSYKDISTVMDVSVSNVGFMLHTALKTLRRRLEAVGLGVEDWRWPS